MSPEVYMCYLINARGDSFRRLLRKYDDFKPYRYEVTYQIFKSGLKSHKSSGWDNFNIRKLLNFINEYILETK